MRQASFHHIGLTVSDLERSIRFYRDLVGLAVRERDEVKGGQVELLTGVSGTKVRIADLDFGNGRTLELSQYLAPPGRAINARPNDAGYTHVGIEVEDVDLIYRRLAQAGVIFRSEPITLENAGPFWTGARVVHALDPDGLTVELVQMPQQG